MAETHSLHAIYEEHFQFVWKSLRRLGVRESDVADAVQDVFIVVHRKLSEFEGRSKITTWLFAIAMRVAQDRSKLAHVRRRVDDEGAISGCVDETVDIAADAERRQGLALLEIMLDEMPIEQRAVFALFELDGVTGDGIAELLEIPLGTVYSRLRLARESFQRSVARHRARDGFRRGGAAAAPGGTAAPPATGPTRRAPPPPPRRRSPAVSQAVPAPRDSGIRDVGRPDEASPVEPTARRMAFGGAS